MSEPVGAGGGQEPLPVDLPGHVPGAPAVPAADAPVSVHEAADAWVLEVLGDVHDRLPADPLVALAVADRLASTAFRVQSTALLDLQACTPDPRLGRERSGTFAAQDRIDRQVRAEAAVTLGLSELAVSTRLAHAQAIRDTPIVGELLDAGRLGVRHAQAALDELTALGTDDQARSVADQVARTVLGPLADPVLDGRDSSAGAGYRPVPHRLVQQLRRAAVAADPELAARRRAEQTARRTDVRLRAGTDGLADLTATCPAVQASAAMSLLDALAGTRGARPSPTGPGDDRTVGQRRVDALLSALVTAAGGRAVPVELELELPALTVVGRPVSQPTPDGRDIALPEPVVIRLDLPTALATGLVGPDRTLIPPDDQYQPEVEHWTPADDLEPEDESEDGPEGEHRLPDDLDAPHGMDTSDDLDALEAAVPDGPFGIGARRDLSPVTPDAAAVPPPSRLEPPSPPELPYPPGPPGSTYPHDPRRRRGARSALDRLHRVLPGRQAPPSPSAPTLLPRVASGVRVPGFGHQVPQLRGHGPIDPALVHQLLEHQPLGHPPPHDSGLGLPVGLGQVTVRRVLLDRTGQAIAVDDQPRPVTAPLQADLPTPAPATAAYTPTRRQRRAVTTRDRHCQFPGCHRPAAVDRSATDNDHRRPHPDGPTSTANLHPLCRHHHQLKQRGWHPVRSLDGTTTWTSPLQQTARTPPATAGT